MGLLGRIIKRQSGEDSEDLDLDDEMVDTLDMPGQEGGSRLAILGKVLKWRLKGESEEIDEADQDEDPALAGGPSAPEEDSPVQVVRLEGIPDVHPVGDSNSIVKPGQEQIGPAPGTANPAASRPGPSPDPEAHPAANSSPGEDNTPVDLAAAVESDTMEGSSDPHGENLLLSLEDIFGEEEEEEVNENLRDLADFVEDTPAQELAGELRDLLEQLEARQR